MIYFILLVLHSFICWSGPFLNPIPNSIEFVFTPGTKYFMQSFSSNLYLNIGWADFPGNNPFGIAQNVLGSCDSDKCWMFDKTGDYTKIILQRANRYHIFYDSLNNFQMFKGMGIPPKIRRVNIKNNLGKRGGGGKIGPKNY